MGSKHCTVMSKCNGSLQSPSQIGKLFHLTVRKAANKEIQSKASTEIFLCIGFCHGIGKDRTYPKEALFQDGFTSQADNTILCDPSGLILHSINNCFAKVHFQKQPQEEHLIKPIELTNYNGEELTPTNINKAIEIQEEKEDLVRNQSNDMIIHLACITYREYIHRSTRRRTISEEKKTWLVVISHERAHHDIDHSPDANEDADDFKSDEAEFHTVTFINTANLFRKSNALISNSITLITGDSIKIEKLHLYPFQSEATILNPHYVRLFGDLWPISNHIKLINTIFQFLAETGSIKKHILCAVDWWNHTEATEFCDKFVLKLASIPSLATHPLTANVISYLMKTKMLISTVHSSSGHDGEATNNHNHNIPQDSEKGRAIRSYVMTLAGYFDLRVIVGRYLGTVPRDYMNSHQHWSRSGNNWMTLAEDQNQTKLTKEFHNEANDMIWIMRRLGHDEFTFNYFYSICNNLNVVDAMGQCLMVYFDSNDAGFDKKRCKGNSRMLMGNLNMIFSSAAGIQLDNTNHGRQNIVILTPLINEIVGVQTVNFCDPSVITSNCISTANIIDSINPFLYDKKRKHTDWKHYNIFIPVYKFISDHPEKFKINPVLSAYTPSENGRARATYLLQLLSDQALPSIGISSQSQSVFLSQVPNSQSQPNLLHTASPQISENLNVDGVIQNESDDTNVPSQSNGSAEQGYFVTVLLSIIEIAKTSPNDQLFADAEIFKIFLRIIHLHRELLAIIMSILNAKIDEMNASANGEDDHKSDDEDVVPAALLPSDLALPQDKKANFQNRISAINADLNNTIKDEIKTNECILPDINWNLDIDSSLGLLTSHITLMEKKDKKLQTFFRVYLAMLYMNGYIHTTFRKSKTKNHKYRDATAAMTKEYESKFDGALRYIMVYVVILLFMPRSLIMTKHRTPSVVRKVTADHWRRDPPKLGVKLLFSFTYSWLNGSINKSKFSPPKQAIMEWICKDIDTSWFLTHAKIMENFGHDEVETHILRHVQYLRPITNSLRQTRIVANRDNNIAFDVDDSDALDDELQFNNNHNNPRKRRHTAEIHPPNKRRRCS